MQNNLLLCVPKGWENYISCEFQEIHLHLQNLGWKKLIIDEESDDLILEAIRGADIVLLWEAYELIERHEELFFGQADHQQRRVFFCDDPHFFSSYRRHQRLRAFTWADAILATYPEKIKQWYPEIAHEKIHWTPHSVASYFYPEFSPTDDRVLLSGAKTWPYPFRQFCQLKLIKEVCDNIDHPGYPGYPGDKHNRQAANAEKMQQIGREKYGDLLRRYPAMLVCGSIFHYLVSKVFEGMASGCLVICERESLAPQLSALGFIAGEHYIGTDIFHVQEDVQQVRNIFLTNPEQWRITVEKAATKVQEEHTTLVRSHQIHSLSTCSTDQTSPGG
jgi:hypothetical protein